MTNTKWKLSPFEKAVAQKITASELKAKFTNFNRSDKEWEAAAEMQNSAQLFLNDIYQVAMRTLPSPSNYWPEIIHLSVKRIDREAIHDWRDLQEIKNMIVGPEFDAVELYPKESRLVDTANQYHLWVLGNASAQFPFGFTERFTMDGDNELTSYNTRQRPRKKE